MQREDTRDVLNLISKRQQQPDLKNAVPEVGDMNPFGKKTEILGYYEGRSIIKHTQSK
jgi:hypothetical protein